MARKILFISLAGLISSIVMLPALIAGTAPSVVQADTLNHNEMDALEKASILNASIHIIFYPKRIDESDGHSAQGEQDRSEAGVLVQRARGVGTVVSYGPRVLIITHDHWEWMNDALGRVEFRNANNVLLLEMSGEAFANIVRYRDGGTLVLDAPGILLSSGIVPASLNQESRIMAGSTVYVAYRPLENRDLLDLRAAVVESIGDDAGRSILNLRSLDGESFVVGDSGGGVWFDGQLMGNLWMSLVVETVVQETRIWGTREIIETRDDASIAARFPLDAQDLDISLSVGAPSETAEQ
jgi:hypothetical protein